VYAIGYRVLTGAAERHGQPMAPAPMRPINGPLLVGALLFGVGWGLSGFCPGPAVIALASGALPVAIFVGSMVAGMLLYSALRYVVRPAAGV
jgi:uncharacterized membrane protein YedE/YeeE